MNGARSQSVASQARAAVLTAVAIAALCLSPAVVCPAMRSEQRPISGSSLFSSATAKPAAEYAVHSLHASQGRAVPQYQNREAPQPYQPVSRPSAGRGRDVHTELDLHRAGRWATSYPGTAQQLYAPPGHLGAWLNNHRNVPVPQQQQMLRNDPELSDGYRRANNNG